MQQAIESRAVPIHLWIVGILSLLWNAFGAYDYVMSRLRDTDYLATMMPDVDPNATLAWIDAFPIWAQFGWGLGVWLGLIGSALLLARHRLAAAAFALSLIGTILGLGYQIAIAPPLPGAEGPLVSIMPWVIIAVALGLFLYARAQKASGVLR
ncbi:MAG TPA: hypothetical protein VFK50_07950 [Sphingomicrobium sp.]|nr:hypothetical protein [Sphingomicrobium sp.]